MKRGRWKIGLLILVLLLSISQRRRGVVQAGEISQLELASVLGLDAGEQAGTVRVLALADEIEAGQSVLVETEQDSMARAVSDLRVIPDMKLFFGHVEQLILGEAAAKQDIGQQLDYIARDVSMRLRTDVYVVKGGTANALMRATTNQQSNTFDFLRDAEDDVLILPTSYPFSAKEILQHLLATDGCALAAALVVEKQPQPPAGEDGQSQPDPGGQAADEAEETEIGRATAGKNETGTATAKQVIRLDGYAVFRDYRLAGYIDGADAPGVNLLLGRLYRDYVNVHGPEGGTATLNVLQEGLRVKPEFEKGRLVQIVISEEVSADINEVHGVEHIMSPAVLQCFCDQLCRNREALIRRTLVRAQAFQADYLGIGARVEIAAPGRWKKLASQWKTLFPTVVFQVDVSARINQTYDMEAPVQKHRLHPEEEAL